MLGIALAAELLWLAWLGATSAFTPIGKTPGSQESKAAAPAPPDTRSVSEAEPSPEPAPEDDDAPVDRTPSVEPEREKRPREPAAAIEVLGPDSRPCAYCPIVAVRGDAVVWRGVTNDLGIESDCRPAEKPVDLLIDACTSLHRVENVTLADCERRQVILPAARSISGRVTFDDGLPFPTEELGVELFRDTDLASRRALAPAPRKTLEMLYHWGAKAPVGPDGSFVFAGVDPEFEGHIAIRPVERVLVVDPARPRERLLTLPVRPDEPLVVHLRRHPIVSGSLVKRAMPSGEGRLRVTLVATLPDSAVVSRWNGCDLGSRFEIPLDFQKPVTVRLEVESLDGRIARTSAVAGPFDRDVDVGALEPPDELAPRSREDDFPDEAWLTERIAAFESRHASWVERTVRGTVVGEDGGPVPNAMVSARGASWRETDDDGAFELGPWLPPKVALRIEARGYLPVDLTDLDLADLDGRTFVMGRGRSVRLTVVDDRGEPFVRSDHLGHCDHGWEASGTMSGAELPFFPDDGLAPMAPRSMGGHPQSPAGPGVYDFLGLPDGAIRFHVEGVEGPVYTLDHDTRVPEARLVVPAHGSIRLRLDTLLDDRRMRVRIEPAFAGGTALRFLDTTTPYDGTLLLPAILPGDYVVTFERPRDPGWDAWMTLGSPARVTVRAGQTTVVTASP